MSALSAAMFSGADISNDEALFKHAAWADKIFTKYDDINADNIGINS